MAMVIILTVLMIVLTAACALLWKKQLRPDTEQQGYIVIPCTEHTEQLELTVKSAYWDEMMEEPAKRREILIVKINACANGYLADRIAQELAGVDAIDITALSDRIKRGS